MAPTRWPVARIDTLGDLAEWLELDAGQLAWLADRRGLERTVAAEKLRNYRYGLLPRPGGVPRMLERPKRRLKEVQRSILRGILDAIPPHDAAHGFTRGRSAVTHAQAHERKRLLLRFDVEDFFCSVAAGRAYGIFRTAGYPESVAHALTALCTNVVPHEEWARVAPPREPWLLARYRRLERRLATPHLPQGSPSSPALANLCAFRLDARLAGLAASVGAAYTRYADDLALSGDDRLRSVQHVVGEIAADEGFRLNERKSQLMTRAGRQLITGIVVNEHANLVRPEFDRLKATLHRAERNGPGALDRAHVLGRIAWVEQLNPGRGAKLRERFERIAW